MNFARTRMLMLGVPAVVAANLIGVQATWANEEDKAKARENFLQADVNGDRMLTFDEFKLLIDFNAEDDLGRAWMVRRFNKYDTAFERVDADADGFVTPEEMKAAAEAAQ